MKNRLSWFAWSLVMLFRPSFKELTPYEADLERQLVAAGQQADQDSRELRNTIAYKDNRIWELELDNKKFKSEVIAAQHEIRLLADIHERDRKRVEADLAAYSAQIAIAERPAQQRRTS